MCVTGLPSYPRLLRALVQTRRSPDAPLADDVMQLATQGARSDSHLLHQCACLLLAAAGKQLFAANKFSEVCLNV